METVDFLSTYDNNNDGPKDRYLTFTAQKANSTVRFNLIKNDKLPTEQLQLEYSTDNGKTWNEYELIVTTGTTGTDEGQLITIENVGDSVKFRGNNSFFSYNDGLFLGQMYRYYFSMTGSIAASGDITSLNNNFGGDYFIDAMVNYELYGHMFQGCTSLTTAPELPATTLANYCYSYMFYGCTNLTEAPELPATTLVDHCYDFMFFGCSNLNYIKAMFLTNPEENGHYPYTNSWVNGVSQTGTFVKNANATWSLIGGHGIPDGWTVETANE